jgi:5-methyltetrahydrofolate--homocysteine methyltransferase
VAFVDWGTVSLAAYLGAEVELTPDTVWYHPRPGDPLAWGPLRFDPAARWFRIHEDIYRQCMQAAAGDFVVGQPGIGSNIEVLAALRGAEALMADLIERPEWVQERLWEINQAFFAAYQRVHELIRLPDGSLCSSYFAIWGPGRTSVITLDPLAMISPAMFKRHVLPPLVEQVRWLDRSLLHVDGTAALRHLDLILGIEELDAVEWTPEPGVPGGGDPRWYPLYRRIKAAGKAVQAILVKPEEVVPMLDAVGPEGMYITAYCRDAAQAERLLQAVEPYSRALAR